MKGNHLKKSHKCCPPPTYADTDHSSLPLTSHKDSRDSGSTQKLSPHGLSVNIQPTAQEPAFSSSWETLLQKPVTDGSWAARVQCQHAQRGSQPLGPQVLGRADRDGTALVGETRPSGTVTTGQALLGCSGHQMTALRLLYCNINYFFLSKAILFSRLHLLERRWY